VPSTPNSTRGPAQLAERLAASRRALLAAGKGLTDAAARSRPAADEWSVLEVLAHLVDTDYHYAQEALAMRDHRPHMLVPFDDAAWKRDHPDVNERRLADVLTALAESHASVLQQVALMSDDDLDVAGRHPRGIPYTVRDVFLRLPPHDENHAKQIEAIVAAIRSKGLT
jgi:uncharacterized damage-inducible protein DinB